MTAALESALVAEVERVHIAHVCNGPPDGYEPVSAPEPCERCGTRVFALRDRAGAVALFHVGWIKREDKAACVRHLPERCSAARRFGVRLEGMTGRQIQALLSPPRDETNTSQLGLFGDPS